MDDLRLNFLTDEGLLPTPLPADPMPVAESWLREASERAVQPNPNALTLATVGLEAQPAARVVLCKGFVADPGYLVFYTNYQSRKSREIAANARVSALMHWDRMGRQVRVEGVAVRSPAEESDEYFASRPRGSQLGAWASDQSEPIGSREHLLDQLRQRAHGLGVTLDAQLTPADGPAIPRPPHWGGFRVWAAKVELWVEGASRIHDRAVWERRLTRDSEHGFRTGKWRSSRLQP